MTDRSQRTAADGPILSRSRSNTPYDAEGGDIGLFDLLGILTTKWRLLLVLPLLIAALALAATFAIPPTFTARTSFLPPQQQTGASAALASLGALAALAGSAGIKTPADQYVSLMQSATVSDRLIERFKLLEVYDVDYRIDARKKLAKNVAMTVGKKDGLISVDVDDRDANRAAAMANEYIEELRRVTSQIAVTDAQQRRVFFETQLKTTKDNLTKAQQTLQESGFNQGAIKSEPKAAAEGYARLRAELTAAEVKLQAGRRSFTDAAPELQQQLATVNALRGQLSRLESTTDVAGGADYVTKFREFKYQETLFELFARQYELARVDESREGALIQVVDVATPPEKKSHPMRSLIAAGVWLAALLLTTMGLMVRHFWRQRESARTAPLD